MSGSKKWSGLSTIPHPDTPSHLPLHPNPLGLPSAPDPTAWASWEAGDLQTCPLSPYSHQQVLSGFLLSPRPLLPTHTLPFSPWSFQMFLPLLGLCLLPTSFFLCSKLKRLNVNQHCLVLLWGHLFSPESAAWVHNGLESVLYLTECPPAPSM